MNILVLKLVVIACCRYLGTKDNQPKIFGAICVMNVLTNVFFKCPLHCLLLTDSVYFSVSVVWYLWSFIFVNCITWFSIGVIYTLICFYSYETNMRPDLLMLLVLSLSKDGRLGYYVLQLDLLRKNFAAKSLCRKNIKTGLRIPYVLPN